MSLREVVTTRKRPRSPSTASYSEQLQASRDAYSRQDYAVAQKHIAAAYHAARERSATEQIQVLDIKCSILVKTGQLDSALEAAKSMIRCDRQNARGYCRAASIERTRGNLESALRYLEHGQARSSRSDDLRAHLLEQLIKLQKAVGEARIIKKPADPAAVFPLEIFEMIMQYVPYRQAVVLLRVSRSWRNLLLQVEPLLTTLDMRMSSKQITGTSLKAALNRIGSPRVVALHNLAPKIGFLLVKALKHSHRFASLEVLTLNKTDIQLDSLPFGKLNLRVLRLGMECRVNTSQIFRILQLCPKLEEARFRRVHESPSTETPVQHAFLQRLHLGNPFELSSYSIPAACFTNYPNLRDLTVSGAAVSPKASWDLSSNSQLEYLNTFASVVRTIQLPPSLREWLWDGTQLSHFMTSRESLEAAGSLPNLQSVCLSGGNTSAVLKYLHASGLRDGQLQRVGLHWRQDAMLVRGSRPEAEIVAGARALSFECDGLQDADLPAFISRFPNLEDLCLVAPQITGVFVKDLLGRSENRVRKIVLKHCVKISPDTIGWITSQNIEVDAEECSVPQEDSRLKRLQYLKFNEQHRD